MNILRPFKASLEEFFRKTILEFIGKRNVEGGQRIRFGHDVSFGGWFQGESMIAGPTMSLISMVKVLLARFI